MRLIEVLHRLLAGVTDPEGAQRLLIRISPEALARLGDRQSELFRVRTIHEAAVIWDEGPVRFPRMAQGGHLEVYTDPTHVITVGIDSIIKAIDEDRAAVG